MLKNKARFFTALIAIILLGAMFMILLLQANLDSGTTDEVAHIPAGYSYVKKLDFRLNPEHPPLAKALAGFPLLFLKIKGPFTDWSWDAANQWEAGWNMLYEQGDSADQILFWSRFPMAILAVILGLIIFFWIKSIFGRKIALLILFLFTLCPTFLAHSHLVTTDLSATLGFVIGVWGIVNFLNKRTWPNLILAGVLFGLAQTLKFSCFLLIPILFLIILAKVFLERKDLSFSRNLIKTSLHYALILLIGFFVVWLIYIPFTWNMTPEIEHKVIEENMRADDIRTLPVRNFLHHFEHNRFTRPAGHYLLGLFYVFGRTAGGNDTFILNYFSNKGIKWYFPVAWLIKIPLPITILLIYGIVILLTQGVRDKKDAWLLWYLSIPIIIYWAITLKGSLNIGIRHLLPTMPFVYLFIARATYPIINPTGFRINSRVLRISQVLLVVLGVWYMVSTLANYPHYLAYFNELTFGRPKHNFLVDSNLDWGQDLKRLAKYIEEQNIDKIRIDYFGGAVPSYYIDENKIIDWHSDQGPFVGWLAVSATYFQFSKMYGIKEGKWDYNWLSKFEPEKNIGGSILVYNLTEEDLLRFPPEPLAEEIKITPEEAEKERQQVKGWQTFTPGTNGWVMQAN